MTVINPLVGNIQPTPPEGPAPQPQDTEIIGFRRPYVGQAIHFFPHRGHHPEWYFGPHAGLVIKIHDIDPRIVHVYFFGPKGEVGSYENIPHRSLRPECVPVGAWLGRAMPPSTHWCHVDE